jgi:hypothetical protein
MIVSNKIAATIKLSEQLKLEYGTLRNEIEAAKAWEYRLLIGGLLGFPAAFEWVTKSRDDAELSFIVLFLPAGVLILSLLVAFVRRSAMRCSSYIHDVLEPHFPLYGWESWLEASSTHRKPERLLAWAFLVLILAYYLIAALIAAHQAQRNLGLISLAVCAPFYLAGWIVTGLFAWTPTSNKVHRTR